MRRDAAANHLTRLIAAARRLKGRWQGHGTFLDLIGDPDLHRLRPNIDPQENQSLRAAFEAFDLDSNEPENWRVLLALFAEAYFVPSRRRGGTKQWDGYRLCQLLADFAVVKKDNPDLQDVKICELVKKEKAFGKRYSDVRKATTILRRLRDARNPTENEILGNVLKALPPLDPRGMTAEQRREFVVELISRRWKTR
jgi:hypothetical protein